MRRFLKLLLLLLPVAILLVVGHLAANRMLVAAAEANSLSRARLALLLGARPNAWDPNREQSPLHYAAFAGNLDLVRLLLDRGAEVNAENLCSQTPLTWAAGKGHVEVARLLLERGARVDIRDDDRECTPLGWAVMDAPAPQNVEIVKLLLQHGADVNADIETPLGPMLERAEGVADKPLVDLLLAYGAKRFSGPSRDQPQHAPPPAQTERSAPAPPARGDR